MGFVGFVHEEFDHAVSRLPNIQRRTIIVCLSCRVAVNINEQKFRPHCVYLTHVGYPPLRSYPEAGVQCRLVSVACVVSMIRADVVCAMVRADVAYAMVRADVSCAMVRADVV